MSSVAINSAAASTSTTDACVMIDARYLNGSHSGIGRYTEQLIRHLVALDDTLRLRLITDPRRPRPMRHERIDHQTFWAAPNSLSTRHLLARRIDFSGVDLFHSPFNILPAGLPVPAVFTLHDIMWLLDPGLCTSKQWKRWVTGSFYRTFIPHSAREAAAILTVSEHSRGDIEAWFPEVKGRVAVSPNGISNDFRPVPPARGWPLINQWLPPRSRFALIVGQGTPYKNHAGALRAFVEALADDPDTYFVMVRRLHGRGDAELKELMADPRLNSRVIPLNYVSFEQLQALYSLATAFLFPSLYEGFGLPALEAMACGTAVVASDRGAPAEVCGDGAVLVDPDDTDQMAHALRRLFYDDEYRHQVEARGLRRAGSFRWENTAREALNLYRRVLSWDEHRR